MAFQPPSMPRMHLALCRKESLSDNLLHRNLPNPALKPRNEVKIHERPPLMGIMFIWQQPFT
jgi:hypothetical protein